MSNTASNPPPRCCCCRCETVVKILSWTFIVGNALTFVFLLYSKLSDGKQFDLATTADNEKIPQWLREYLEQQKSIMFQHSPPNVLFWVAPFTIVIFALVLIGCHRRKSAYFLPYLIGDAIVFLLGMIGVVHLFFTSPKSPIPCLLLAIYTLKAWIYSVYFRVYKFIKDEEKGGTGPKDLPYIEEGAENVGNGTTGGIHDLLISKPEN